MEVKLKNKIVELDGFEISTDSLYKVLPKFDASAPDGFKKHGTTKVLGAGISDSITCPFTAKDDSLSDGVYDTGFYIGSKCYAGKTKEEEKIIVSKLQESIVEPYERKYGQGILHYSNFEFWDNYRVSLFHNRVFNPNNIDHLLDLYIGILSHELTPVNKEGSPAYRNSSFLVENATKVVEFKLKESNNTMDAIGVFSEMLKQKPVELYNVLRYVSMIDNNVNLSENVLKDSFFKWVTAKDSKKRVDAFNRALSLMNKETTRDVIPLYVALRDSYRKNIVTKSGGFLYYKNEQIGSTFKEAASRINVEQEFKDIKSELLIPEEE